MGDTGCTYVCGDDENGDDGEDKFVGVVGMVRKDLNRNRSVWWCAVWYIPPAHFFSPILVIAIIISYFTCRWVLVILDDDDENNGDKLKSLVGDG